MTRAQGELDLALGYVPPAVVAISGEREEHETEMTGVQGEHDPTLEYVPPTAAAISRERVEHAI